MENKFELVISEGGIRVSIVGDPEVLAEGLAMAMNQQPKIAKLLMDSIKLANKDSDKLVETTEKERKENLN